MPVTAPNACMRRLLDRIYGIYALTVIGIAMFLVGAPLMMLMPSLTLRRRVGRLGVRIGLLLAGTPVHIEGTGNLPPGACLVAANHASYFDGPLLTAALPERFTFVVQNAAGDWPYVGLIIRRMGVSLVNRASPRESARQMRALIRRLQGGESLAVFPEGTFEERPGLLPFRDGVFMVAAHANVPVVPAVITGTRHFYGEGHRLPRPSRITIRFLQPISATGSHREEIRKLRDRTRAAMLEHCGEPDLALAPSHA